jgi:hypothetical protein
VHDTLELSEYRQPGEVIVLHAADLEDAVGADLDAVALALALVTGDHRSEFARRGTALLAGTVRVGCCAAGLLSIQ